MELPARMIATEKFILPFPNEWGYSLKIAIRNEAKKLSLYRIPIELEPLVTGINDEGEEIPINVLGRWVFGVPGYAGHIKIIPNEVGTIIEYPNIPEVEKLLLESIQNLNGGMKMEKKYDVITNYFNANVQGMYIIQKDNKYGIMNEKEQYILEPIYCHIRDFVEGFALLQKNIGGNTYKYNLVDINGKFISDKWFDFAGEFSCGLCLVSLDLDNETKCRFIKKDGTFLKDLVFYSASDFCDNIAKVKFNYEDEWCFIDTDGEILRHKTYPEIKNGYEPTYVIYSEQGNVLQIIQIRSSKVIAKNIEEFEAEILQEKLCKTDEKSFLRLARKIRKEFEK